MTTIYLVRHGEYENPDYVFPCRLPGFGLSVRGRAQVRQLAASYFANKPVVALYSSPLLRTKQTAQILAETLHLSIMFDDRLLEVTTHADGVPMKLFDETNGGLSYTPEYQAKGAESIEDLIIRMDNFIQEKVRKHQGREVLIVTHGDPMRYVVMKYMRIVPITFEASRSVAIPIAGGYKIEFSDTGEAQVYPIVTA